MHQSYNGPDDYLMRHAADDYVPSRLQVQEQPGTFIEFGLMAIGKLVKYLLIH